MLYLALVVLTLQMKTAVSVEYAAPLGAWFVSKAKTRQWVRHRPMPDAALGSERKENAGARPRVIALARIAPSRIARVRIACA